MRLRRIFGPELKPEEFDVRVREAVQESLKTPHCALRHRTANLVCLSIREKSLDGVGETGEFRCTSKFWLSPVSFPGFPVLVKFRKLADGGSGIGLTVKIARLDVDGFPCARISRTSSSFPEFPVTNTMTPSRGCLSGLIPSMVDGQALPRHFDGIIVNKTKCQAT